MFVGADLVNGDADFVLQEVLYRGDHAEHADGTGDGVGLGNDLVGVTGDVVTAGSRVVAHGNHDFLAGFLGEFNLVPDILGR